MLSHFVLLTVGRLAARGTRLAADALLSAVKRHDRARVEALLEGCADRRHPPRLHVAPGKGQKIVAEVRLSHKRS